MGYGDETLKALLGKRNIDKQKIYEELEGLAPLDRKRTVRALVKVEREQRAEMRERLEKGLCPECNEPFLNGICPICGKKQVKARGRR